MKVVRRIEVLVILSEAKDLLAGIKRRRMIPRFAQDDNVVHPATTTIRMKRRFSLTG
jgi:hypothetical protein